MHWPRSERVANDRLRQIESVTDAALAHLDVDELLVELLDRTRDLVHADTAAVLLLDATSEQLVAAAARGLEEEVRQDVRIMIGKGFAGRVAADKQPVIIEQVDDTNVANPILREKGVRSLLGVPLLLAGSVMGVLHVGSLVDRRFTDDDVGLLQLVAARVALAIQARTSQTDRAAAAALQRSLLPTQLPAVPGIDMAARYVPGEEGGVGGDWYDVFTLPSGRLCVVIGDVIGRGLPAAVVMGRLRSALRAYTLETEDPGAVLGKLSRKVSHFERDMMATVLCAIVDPSLERVRLSLAGHLAPVLALPDEPAALVDAPIDPPVGAPARRRRRTTAIAIPPGAAMCFYTDGLVERRGDVLDVGLARLCDAVAAGPADSICSAVMAKLVGDDRLLDDIAVLALCRR